MNTKCVITGGAGYIGSQLARELLRRACEVVVVDDLSHGFEENLEQGVDFVRGSVCDKQLIDDAIKGSDYVFHLAAVSRVPISIAHPARAFHTNVMGTINVVESCVRHGVKKLVNVSSCAVYGNGPYPLREDSCTTPMSPYGYSKLIAEEICSYHNGNGIRCLSVRPFNVYGFDSPTKEYGPSSVIHIFAKNIKEGKGISITGDGCQRKDFIYVGDVIRGLIHFASSDVVGVINLWTGNSTSINEVVGKFWDALPGSEVRVMNIPDRPGDPKFVCANVSRMRSSGFRPSASLAHEIKKTINGYGSLWTAVEEKDVHKE